MRLLLCLSWLLCLPLPCFAQPESDATELMTTIMAVLTSPDQPAEAVLQAFLPGLTPADWSISATDGLPPDLNDPKALLFTASLPGKDPMGWDSIAITCLRFGPETLAYAMQDNAEIIGPMLLKSRDSAGWVGSASFEDLPELGQGGQVFPPGAVLRQDCAIHYGMPPDYPIKDLNDWPAVAINEIEARFSTVTTDILPMGADNPRYSFRASASKDQGLIQIPVMLGLMPYRPFDDLKMPAFEFSLRATTYLFSPGS